MTAFTDRPFVYVAGPYIHPDCVENTHKTIMIAEQIQSSGLVTAYVPHLTLLWHLVAPHEADHWYAYDLAILARCDALYRIRGASTGADNEVAFALAHDPPIPVFYHVDDLVAWADWRV